MYPKEIVLPMKAELTDKGFQELLNANDVVELLQKKGTAFVMVNSVCGCSAAGARPAAIQAASTSAKKPTFVTTTFAGYDKEALAKLREYLMPFPPSSPCMALFKDGKLVHFLERHQIEGHSAQNIASNLTQAFEQYC